MSKILHLHGYKGSPNTNIINWLRKMGFDVDSLGYFLYCDGDRFSDYDFLGEGDASMRFAMSLIPYETSLDWIEPTLKNISDCLLQSDIPKHSEGCEFGALYSQLNNL